MRWRRPARDGDDGAFLAGTQSELADFGETGADGFASAWDAGHVDRESGAKDDLFAGFEDKASERARDLDRRSRSGLMFLVLLVLAGLGATAAVRSGVLGDSDNSTAPREGRPNELVAIGDDRSYGQGPAAVAVRVPGSIDRGFVAESTSSDPLPADVVPAMDIEAAFGTVYWGGRTHVGVVARGLDLSVDCVIASLVTADLQVIDLAAHGACSDQFAPTGDRRACLGDEAVLLEVWPYDPDSVVERAAVEAVRVRIERRLEPSGSVASLRGDMLLDGDLAAQATPLLGPPGTTATIRLGDLSASCELLDRAEVRVQLL